MNNQIKPEDQIPITDLAPAEVGELDLYKKREMIYTRKIEGFFQKIRLFTGWPLLLGFILLPWLSMDGQQLVLFDLPARQFHIFMLTFWPQDFSLLAWLLIMSAFGLFLITVWAGRVWCGYTCPQTVWTSIFMWIEQVTEGTRNQRIKLDQAPWSAEKFLRKFAKHTMWLTVGFITGFIFVGYFYPIRELSVDLFTLQTGAWANFWLLFFTSTTYINAGWLREQVCIHMCPYARFQSVMFDEDTLIVAYDPARGEPRGSRKRGTDHKAEGKGDCIDCELCVQVCPTGIDIRDGLQYECITCALCIDACNSVMDKMGYERDLISYTSENALSGKKQRTLRPRLIGYALALLVMMSAFSYHLATRVPLELDIIRDRNKLYTETLEGYIENIYTVKIINMDQSPHRYTLTVGGLDGLKMLGESKLELDAGEVLSLPLRLQMDPALLDGSTSKIWFSVSSDDDQDINSTAESRFIGPRN